LYVRDVARLVGAACEGAVFFLWQRFVRNAAGCGGDDVANVFDGGGRDADLR